ncbi:Kinesin-like motor protein 9, partial [Clarias magur]
PIRQHRCSLYRPCQLQFSMCHVCRVDLSELLTSESHQTVQRRGSLIFGALLNYSALITLEECL